ncbi:MAG: PIG-L family deacetylase [Acidobacteriota bacterium]|nr:PIG-L family deacetylase [Acidobacteriota bacterium]
MAVHAHPDDEASSSGGVLALLAAQGVRTVLVTCTNGEYGDAPGGVKPHTDDHDADVVAQIRAGELDAAVAALGVSRLVRLGYRDSGMRGWPQNDDARSFWATPVEEGARRLAEVMRAERPQVVMTYNEHGFYGHPDHIQAHRITMAALDQLDYEPTVYFNAIPESVMARWRERWEREDRERREAAAARGEELEPEVEDLSIDGEPIELGTPDDRIDAAIDVSSVAGAKYDALAAHASQMADSFWLKMSREEFTAVMGTEWFVRVRNPRSLEGSVSDIMAGYR